MNGLAGAIKKIIKCTLPAPIYRMFQKEYWRLKGELYDEKKFKKKMLAERKTLPVKNGSKVSILCNVWNTPSAFLRQMIESVLEQNYCNWELLLNNCSNIDNQEVEHMLLGYADEKRIKVFRTTNCGIAENTDFLLSQASGEFVLLMDHDDFLLPDTISEMMEAQQASGCDFIYADEIILFMSCRHLLKNIKKSFSMPALERENFINHPALIRMQILKKIGGFRSGFEGSQDHDLYLRICEETEKIHYLPKLLYVWRYNDGSFSARHLDICIESGRKAVQEHLNRMNIAAEVTAEKDRAVFTIHYLRTVIGIAFFAFWLYIMLSMF